MTEPVSRLDLELLALGELDQSAERALRERISAEPDLAERFSRIERDLGAEAPLPELVLPADEEASSRFPPWASLGALAVVLAAALALFMLRPSPVDPGVTFRGSFDLEVVLIRGGVAEPQGLLVPAKAGDKVQYRVIAPEPGFLSVFDVQDDGQITPWNDAVPLRPGEPFEAAAVLDDYPSLERVYFVFSPEPLSAGAFERAVRAAWGPPLADLDTIPGLGETVQRSISVLEDE